MSETLINGYLVFVRHPDINESTADVHFYKNCLGGANQLAPAISNLQLLGVANTDIYYFYWEITFQSDGMPDPFWGVWPPSDKALTHYGNPPDMGITSPGTIGFDREYGGGTQDGYFLFYWNADGTWKYLFDAQTMPEIYDYVSKVINDYDYTRMCLFWWEISFVPGFGYPTPSPDDQLVWVGGGGLGTFETECAKIPTGDEL